MIEPVGEYLEDLRGLCTFLLAKLNAASPQCIPSPSMTFVLFVTACSINVSAWYKAGVAFFVSLSHSFIRECSRVYTVIAQDGELAAADA